MFQSNISVHFVIYMEMTGIQWKTRLLVVDEVEIYGGFLLFISKNGETIEVELAIKLAWLEGSA